MSGGIPYRPEIDGLRAVAVLAVVLYHFELFYPGLKRMGGGFVGVDIFFVISGFLIGGILWRDIRETGRIRLGRFYLRRIRRLAPAFFVMAWAVLALGWLILLPFEFREFGKSLIAATVWLSNIHFHREAGYFDTASGEKPLLHTWSLAVEEQFYIVLPFLMLALLRWRSSVPVILGVVAFTSLAACLWLTRAMPQATFYLFPFRAWELLAGVLLAIAGQERGWRFAVHPALSWAGLALIAASVTLIRPEGFPGWQALGPVLGTLLILANGRDPNRVNRALSHPATVFVGLISYSLYLWHWPVLVLSSYWRGGAAFAGAVEGAGWLALAGLLAVLSWRYVEQPVRRARGGARLLVGATVAGSAALLVLGAVLWRGDGLPARFPPEHAAHIAASGDFNQDWSRCTVPDDGPLAGVETCPIGPEGAPRVLIWGDSHLRAMKEGLEAAAQAADRPALIVWHAGCPPLFGVAKTESAATPAQDAACTAANRAIREGFAQIDSLEAVLLVGRWSYYAEGQGAGRDAHNLVTLAPRPGSGLPEGPQHALFGAALARTVDALGRHVPRVLVLRQPPEIPLYDSRAVARALVHGREVAPEVLRVPRPEAEARAARAEAPLRALAAAGVIDVIDPWPHLCDDAACAVMREGASLYFDNNHLTNRGARALAGLFAPVFGGRP
jgi:peptidoglycan/LPS O-acetylase OafA/YrhL